MRRPAPAKVNLGLSVLARRGDSFHEIETLIARLDLQDDVSVELLTDRAGGVELEILPRPTAGSPAWHVEALASVPTDDGNLAARAAAAYQLAFERETGSPAPGIAVSIVKRVPVAAGLGGGSSDAATVLLALDALLPAGLDLAALGASLGSDVPFFLTGAAAAVARGRGERLQVVKIPRLHLVLAKPETTVSAADAYAALVGFTPRLRHERSIAALTSGQEPRWRNGLQGGVVRAHPHVRTLLEDLRATGLKGVLMSGSGPTCFGVATGADAALEAADLLARRRPDLWVAAATAG